MYRDIAIIWSEGVPAAILEKVGHFENAEAHGNALDELSTLENPKNDTKNIKMDQLLTNT